MDEPIACFDTCVWVKFLVKENPLDESEAAARLILRALNTSRLICPGFAWAEVGSVLRKKVREDLLSTAEADEQWDTFCSIPVEFVENESLRSRTWSIAEQYSLPTLYDAAFLACTELAATEAISVEFWTADNRLIKALRDNRPSYLRFLAEAVVPR